MIGCTGARETFALFEPSGDPIGPAILWSDSRAGYETARGAVSVGAKLDWVAVHRRADLEASAWILAPRDLVVWRLTGQVATDPTLASRTGLYERDDRISAAVGSAVADRLPPVVPPDGSPARSSRRGGRRTRAAQRRAGGHRGRRPAVRGARYRGDPVTTHGELGNDCQRVCARGGYAVGRAVGMVATPRPTAAGSSRVESPEQGRCSPGWAGCAGARRRHSPRSPDAAPRVPAE